MTKKEFENQWCENTGVPAEWLIEYNFEAIPCDCEDDGCQGWQMAAMREQNSSRLRSDTKEVREKNE